MQRGASLWLWLGDLGVEQEMNRFNLRESVLRRCVSAKIMRTVWPETQASSSREWVSFGRKFEVREYCKWDLVKLAMPHPALADVVRAD
jgi:hypothetical protein